MHRATEHGTGAPLAVKVQHAGLREECASDLQAVGLAVAAAEWLYPDDFRLGWVMGEMAPHLPLELDFTRPPTCAAAPPSLARAATRAAAARRVAVAVS